MFENCFLVIMYYWSKEWARLDIKWLFIINNVLVLEDQHFQLMKCQLIDQSEVQVCRNIVNNE